MLRPRVALSAGRGAGERDIWRERRTVRPLPPPEWTTRPLPPRPSSTVSAPSLYPSRSRRTTRSCSRRPRSTDPSGSTARSRQRTRSTATTRGSVSADGLHALTRPAPRRAVCNRAGTGVDGDGRRAAAAPRPARRRRAPAQRPRMGQRHLDRAPVRHRERCGGNLHAPDGPLALREPRDGFPTAAVPPQSRVPRPPRRRFGHQAARTSSSSSSRSSSIIRKNSARVSSFYSEQRRSRQSRKSYDNDSKPYDRPSAGRWQKGSLDQDRRDDSRDSRRSRNPRREKAPTRSAQELDDELDAYVRRGTSPFELTTSSFEARNGLSRPLLLHCTPAYLVRSFMRSAQVI